MSNRDSTLERGQLYWVNRSPARGSEQAGRRPGLIIQNNPFNSNERYPNTIVLAITTSDRSIPIHVEIAPDAANGLQQTSYVKCEQIITISRDRLAEFIGTLSENQMQQIDFALKRVLALN